jgi:hypothetical protein
VRKGARHSTAGDARATKIAQHVAVEERNPDTRVDGKPTVLPGEHGGGVRIEKPLPLDREVAAGHRDRTLAKVDLDVCHWVVGEDVEVAEQVPDRTVAVARAALRFVHGDIEPQGRPANRLMHAWIHSNRSVGFVARTWPVVAIAFALIIGLSGRSFDLCRLIALNESPLGSTPTFASRASRPLSSSARP